MSASIWILLFCKLYSALPCVFASGCVFHQKQTSLTRQKRSEKKHDPEHTQASTTEMCVKEHATAPISQTPFRQLEKES